MRFEERQLFPLIETLLSEETLNTLANAAGTEEQRSHLGSRVGGAERDAPSSGDAGAGPPEHVNGERDVLVVVLAGSATVSADGDEHELAVGEATIIAKGRRRKISAGRNGVRYLSVHRRRAPLLISPAPKGDGWPNAKAE